MRKYIAVFMILISISLMSGCSSKINPQMTAKGLDSRQIERIVISNNRYAGRYTIIDQENIDRFKNNIIKAKSVTTDIKLEPDFVFDLYDSTKKIATFKYIAGVDDENTGNLIDEDNKLYHVNPLIEDEFMKRLMKDGGLKNIQDYYISAISLLIDKSLEVSKTNSKEDLTIIVDTAKDYSITRYLTSIEQKRIFDSIDKKGVKIKFPTEVDKGDFYIKLNTEQYSDKSCIATASVTDKKGTTVKYRLEGNYNEDWKYHIKYN